LFASMAGAIEQTRPAKRPNTKNKPIILRSLRGGG